MSNLQSLAIPALPPVSKFEAYARTVNAIPMLSEEYEKELASQLKEGSKEAALSLIYAHLRLPVKIARAHKGYGLALEDLTQEGNIGLMKAVKRFNPILGVRLSVLAELWVKAEIRAFVLKNWKMVKVATTKTLRKLFYKFKSEKSQLEALGYRGDELDEMLSVKLGIPLHEVKKAHERFEQDVSLDALDENGTPMYEKLGLAYEEKEVDTRESHLTSALESLPDRMKQVVVARYIEEPKKTLQELSMTLGVSVGRVAQIEQQAIKKMKELMSMVDIDLKVKHIKSGEKI